MEEFYTINQTAIVLKVHPLTVRRYIKEGKLKAYRAGGNIRISVNDLKSFTQQFNPKQKNIKKSAESSLNQSQSENRPFTFNDPFFRLRGRGLSLSKLELERK